MEAVRIRETSQARASLLSAVEQNAEHVAFLHSNGSSITTVRVSADGALLATGDVGGTITLWSVPDQVRLRDVQVSSSAVQSLTFSSIEPTWQPATPRVRSSCWTSLQTTTKTFHTTTASVEAVMFSS